MVIETGVRSCGSGECSSQARINPCSASENSCQRPCFRGVSGFSCENMAAGLRPHRCRLDVESGASSMKFVCLTYRKDQTCLRRTYELDSPAGLVQTKDHC